MTKFKGAADLITTLAIMVACGFMIAGNWSRLWPRSPGPPVPATPISLAGATLKGAPTAPVVLLEWSDYQCPSCAAAERDLLPAIEARHIATGKLQLALFHHPLERIHPDATLAAKAALCARVQDKFWQMHSELFKEPKKLKQPDLISRAARVRLDQEQFGECLAGREVEADVSRDSALARKLGLTWTPAFVIARREAPGSDKVRAVRIMRGIRGAADLDASIEEASRPARPWLLSGSPSVYVSLVITLVGAVTIVFLRKRVTFGGRGVEDL